MEKAEDPTATPDDSGDEGSTELANLAPAPAPQPVYYYPPALPTAPMAIVGMVLGILAVTSMFCYGFPGLIFGIAAIITSRLGLAACRRAREEVQGEGLATAGLITGWIGTIGGALFVLVIVAYFVFMLLMFKNMTPPTITPATPGPAPSSAPAVPAAPTPVPAPAPTPP